MTRLLRKKTKPRYSRVARFFYDLSPANRGFFNSAVEHSTKSDTLKFSRDAIRSSPFPRSVLRTIHLMEPFDELFDFES